MPKPKKYSPAVDPTEILTLIDKYFEYKNTKEQEETKRLMITKQAEVEIERIRQQALFLSRVFDRIFDERKKHLDQFIKVLDYGIENSNQQMVAHALAGIQDLVRYSPIRMLGEVREILDRERDEIVEI